MEIALLVKELNDQQLGELGDALRDLPSRRLARVLVHLTAQHRLSRSVEYHLLTATRKIISDAQPNLTSDELLSAERQMMG